MSEPSRSGAGRVGAGWRAVGLAGLMLGVGSLAGCHKHARTQARRYPAPPPMTAGRGEGDADGRVVGEAPRRSEGTGPAVGSGSGGGLAVHGAPFATETGLASWYGPPYAGRKGADGTVYDQNAMTAAHLTLALGTVVRVTNLQTGQSAVVRITDRGPFVRGRIIDLSLRAAKEIGVYRAGVARVRVEAFDAPPLKPNVAPGGRWCVQVGAFATEEDARQEKADLVARYPGARVLAFAGPTGWWVRIHPRIADRTHAEEVEESIHLPDAAQPYMVRTD